MNSERPQNTATSWLFGLTNWLLFVFGAANLAVGTWAAANDRVPMAGTTLTAGLVLLLAATIDRFESVKGLGVEAKTRQLDRKIEQADEALRRIRELSELTGFYLVELSSNAGRLGVIPSARSLFKTAEQVRSTMKSLGSEPAAIALALRPWARAFCADLAFELTSPLRSALFAEIGRLEQVRSDHQPPANNTDADYRAALNRTIAAGQESLRKLNEIGGFELHDFPARFLAALEDVPLLPEQQVRQVRETAKRFETEMVVLQTSLVLQTPDAWFSELDQGRRFK